MPKITITLDTDTDSVLLPDLFRILAKSDTATATVANIAPAVETEDTRNTTRRVTAKKKPTTKAEPPVEVEAEVEDLSDLLDDVRIALKSFAKEHSRDEARDIMSNHKCNSLTDLNKCSRKTLEAILKEIPDNA